MGRWSPKRSFGEVVIKRELVMTTSSKGSFWEVVIRRELLGKTSPKLVGMTIKRELVGRWSSKGSYWGGGHQKRADGEVVTKKGDGGKVVIKRELMGR